MVGEVFIVTIVVAVIVELFIWKLNSEKYAKEDEEPPLAEPNLAELAFEEYLKTKEEIYNYIVESYSDFITDIVFKESKLGYQRTHIKYIEPKYNKKEEKEALKKWCSENGFKFRYPTYWWSDDWEDGFVIDWSDCHGNH